MNFALWLGLALIVAPLAAEAQRADCPVGSASTPMTPPGKPPDFFPQVTFPSTWGGEVKVQTGVILPPGDDPIDAEEGHLAAIARLAQTAGPQPPPADVLAELVDTRKTLLSAWRFEGYILEPQPAGPPCRPGTSPGNCWTSSRHKVVRVFSQGDSTVLFEQWNMAADGAAVVATPPQTIAIGRFSGHTGGLRSPSGCVSATLSWHGEGMSFSLKAFGSPSLQQQRDLLLELGRSIESATPRPNG